MRRDLRWLSVLKYAIEAKQRGLTQDDMRFDGRACGTNKHFVNEAEAELANKLEIAHNLDNERALGAIPGGREHLVNQMGGRSGFLGSIVFPKKTTSASTQRRIQSTRQPNSWSYTSPAFRKSEFEKAGLQMNKLFQDPRHDSDSITIRLMLVLRSYLRADLFALFILIIVFWG